MIDTEESPELRTAATLLAADTFLHDCPSRTVLDQVTTRWGTLVIAALVHGPHRFSALAHRVEGISQKMLSQTLKSLTPLGADLAVPLTRLIHWFGENTANLRAAQTAYDIDRG